MSDGNRGKGIAAVVGVVLLFWTFGLGLYVGSLNDPQEQRHQAYRYAADKPLEVDATAPGKPGAQPLEYRTPCQNPKGKDESDLCAQWRAANAAEDSAFWAKWGFWIGLGGMVGLFWTLYYTRRAVQDTGAATDAMREANEIARISNRAWLKISDVKVHYIELNDSPRIDHRRDWFACPLEITVENVGSLPATNLRCVARMWFSPADTFFHTEWAAGWEAARREVMEAAKEGAPTGGVLFPDTEKTFKISIANPHPAIPGTITIDRDDPRSLRLFISIFVICKIGPDEWADTMTNMMAYIGAIGDCVGAGKQRPEQIGLFRIDGSDEAS